MPMHNATFSTSILALGLSCLAGCNSDPTTKIKLVPVIGTVTFKNKPLEGALVTFTPDESNAANTPGGDSTGPDGNYRAMYRGRSGLAPGKYKVKVVKTVLPPGAVKGSGDDPYMSQVAAESLSQAGGKSAAAPLQLEGEFDREVEEGGSTVDFDVKGKELPVSAAK